MILPDSDGINFIRFYMDGLVVHMYEDEMGDFVETIGNIAIGAKEKLSVLGIKYETSAQEEWLRDLLQYHYDNHLDLTNKILGIDE